MIMGMTDRLTIFGVRISGRQSPLRAAPYDAFQNITSVGGLLMNHRWTGDVRSRSQLDPLTPMPSFHLTLRYFLSSRPSRIATNLVYQRFHCLHSMSSYPTQIKAIQVTSHGGPEVLAVGPSVLFPS